MKKQNGKLGCLGMLAIVLLFPYIFQIAIYAVIIYFVYRLIKYILGSKNKDTNVIDGDLKPDFFERSKQKIVAFCKTNKKLLIGVAAAYAAMFMIGIISIIGFSFSNSSDDTASSSFDYSTTTTTTSKKADSTSAKSVDFFAPGTYKVGEDIQPGSYYAVLTDMQFATNDDKHSGYINIEVNSSSNNSKFYEAFIRDVNKPYRITLKKGDTIVLSDNYSPTWNVSFFTLEDYKKHQSSDKSTSSSSSASTSTPEPTSTQTETAISSSATPAPSSVAPAPVPSSEPQSQTVSQPQAAYYDNCTAVKNAGAAPIHAGDPGYGSHLDRDGDGVGCEY